MKNHTDVLIVSLSELCSLWLFVSERKQIALMADEKLHTQVSHRLFATSRSEMRIIMRYTWLDEYLLKKRAVTKDLKKEWNWIRYQIGGKMFAAVCLDSEDKPYYINLKLEPMEGEFLRNQYEDIIPGYYSDKRHWNSIRPDGEVPDDLLKDLLDKSYELVLAGFSKKKQREVLGLTVCGMECGKCGFYGELCQGCNESGGKVFHAPAGKPCPIYQCSVNKCKYATCASCDDLPCGIWQDTRDPSLSQGEFDATIRDRVKNLKGESE